MSAAGRVWYHREMAVFAVTSALLGGGVVAWLSGAGATASGVWAGAAVLGLGYSTVSLIEAIRRRVPIEAMNSDQEDPMPARPARATGTAGAPAVTIRAAAMAVLARRRRRRPGAGGRPRRARRRWMR